MNILKFKGFSLVKNNLIKYINLLYGFLRQKPSRTLLVFILFTAFLTRVIFLAKIPPLFSIGEIEVIKRVQSIEKASDLWLGIYFKEGIYLYLLAFFSKIFGTKIIVFRLLSAIIGTATVYLTFIFTKEWFNRRTGYFASFLLAVSSWHITLSRNIDPDILFPFIILLILTTVNYAFRTKKNLYFILSGLLFGIGLYVSPFFLFAPFLFILSGIYFYLKNNKFVTAYIKEITLAVNAFILISLPYFISFVKFRPYFLKDFYIKSFSHALYNFGLIIQSLFSKGEVNYLNNLGAEPLLDPFTAVLFLFGFLYMVFNIKKRKNFFLLMMFFVFMLPGVFSKTTVVDKSVGLIPVICIFSGFTLNYVASHWFKTFPFNKSARAFLKGSFIFFFILTAFYHYQKYFIVWGNSKNVQEIYKYEFPCACNDKKNEIKY